MGSTDHSTVEAVDTPSISAVGVLRAVGGPITAMLKMYIDTESDLSGLSLENCRPTDHSDVENVQPPSQIPAV